MNKPNEMMSLLYSTLEEVLEDNNHVDQLFWNEVDLTMESFAVAFSETNCFEKALDAVSQIKDIKIILQAMYSVSHILMNQKDIKIARKTVEHFIKKNNKKFIMDDELEISRYLIKLWVKVGRIDKALLEIRKIISKNPKIPEPKTDKILELIKTQDENAALREIAKDDVYVRRVAGLVKVAKSFALKGNLDMAKEVIEWLRNQTCQINEDDDIQDCLSKLAYLYTLIGYDDEALTALLGMNKKNRIITLAFIADEIAKGNSTSRAIFFCQAIGRSDSISSLLIEGEYERALDLANMLRDNLDAQLLKLDIAEKIAKESKDWTLRIVQSEVEESYLTAQKNRGDGDITRYCVIALARAVEILVGIQHFEVARKVIKQMKELVGSIYGAEDASPAFALMAQSLAFVNNNQDSLNNARNAEDLSKKAWFKLYGYDAWVRIQIMKAYALSEDYQNANRIFREMDSGYRDEATGEIYVALMRKGKKDIAIKFLMDGLKEKYHCGNRLMKLVRFILNFISAFDEGETMEYMYEELKAVLIKIKKRTRHHQRQK